MAVFTDPIDFVSLWSTDGLGWLVGIRDATTDTAGRQNAVNWAYLELAGIKGYWRRRSSEYTSSSSPALTANTRAYNVPSDYNDPYRVYYRSSGQVIDVPILGDSQWLERSATRNADAGYPQYARVVHNGSSFQVELNRPISQAFIDTIGTLTLEYGIRVAQLANATDQPILPPNLRPHILPLAAWKYLLTQGDDGAADRWKPEAERARAEVLKYDLTRTGRPRQLRPAYSYLGTRGRAALTRDYETAY